MADGFDKVLGDRRGAPRATTASPSQPQGQNEPPPWWRWEPRRHRDLSDWLDHVYSCGYRTLVVKDTHMPSRYTVRASHPGHQGYAVYGTDSDAVAWLLDRWPDDLVEVVDDRSSAGRLA